MLRMRQRYLSVGVCKETLMVRREPITRYLSQNFQYALIEYVPGAYLLLDHLFTDVGRQHVIVSDWTYCRLVDKAKTLRVFHRHAKQACDKIWSNAARARVCSAMLSSLAHPRQQNELEWSWSAP
jgi:hypothetical protein